MAGNLEAGGIDVVFSADATKVVAAAATARAALNDTASIANTAGENAAKGTSKIGEALNKVKEATKAPKEALETIGKVGSIVGVAATFFSIGKAVEEAGEKLLGFKDNLSDIQELEARINEGTSAEAKLSRIKKSIDDVKKSLLDSSTLESGIRLAKTIYSFQSGIDLNAIDLAAANKKIQGLATVQAKAEEEVRKDVTKKRVEGLREQVREEQAALAGGEQAITAAANTKYGKVLKAEQDAKAKNKGKLDPEEAGLFDQQRAAIAQKYQRDLAEFRDAAAEKTRIELDEIQERKNAYSNLISEQARKEREENKKTRDEHLKQMQEIANQLKALSYSTIGAINASNSALVKALDRIASK